MGSGPRPGNGPICLGGGVKVKKSTTIYNDGDFLISNKDLPTVFKKPLIGSDEDDRVKSPSKARLTTFNSGEWWIGLDSGKQSGCPQTKMDHRVETSGLHELQGISETLHEEHDKAVREREDISTEVQIPATILPVVDESPKSRRMPLIVGAAATIGFLSGVLLSASLGLSIHHRIRNETAPPRQAQTERSADVSNTVLAQVEHDSREKESAKQQESIANQEAASMQDTGNHSKPIIDSDSEPPLDDNEGLLVEHDEDQDADPRSRRRRRNRREGSEEEDPDDKLDIVTLALKSGPAPAAVPAAAVAKPAVEKRDEAEPVSKETFQEPPPVKKPASKELVDHMLDGIGPDKSSGSRQSSERRESRTDTKTPQQLDRAGISRTMGRHNSRVNQCLRKFGLFHQKIQTRLVVRGSTGEVISAEVLGNYRGAPVATCMLLELRKVRFPEFRQNNQRITLTFVIGDRR